MNETIAETTATTIVTDVPDEYIVVTSDETSVSDLEDIEDTDITIFSSDFITSNSSIDDLRTIYPQELVSNEKLLQLYSEIHTHQIITLKHLQAQTEAITSQTECIQQITSDIATIKDCSVFIFVAITLFGVYKILLGTIGSWFNGI